MFHLPLVGHKIVAAHLFTHTHTHTQWTGGETVSFHMASVTAECTQTNTHTHAQMYSLSSTFFSLAHLFVQRILINLNTAPVFPCYLFEQLSVDFSTLHNSSGLVWKHTHTHTQASFCCVPARLDLDVINAAR